MRLYQSRHFSASVRSYITSEGGYTFSTSMHYLGMLWCFAVHTMVKKGSPGAVLDKDSTGVLLNDNH